MLTAVLLTIAKIWKQPKSPYMLLVGIKNDAATLEYLMIPQKVKQNHHMTQQFHS